jgi:uncharacterized protein
MELTTTQWMLAGTGALMIGFAKTGVPGTGILVVPIMALVFGARESVGIVTPMLIVGDIFAVAYYRRHAQWPQLWRLVPWIIPGIVVGCAVWLALDNEEGAKMFAPLVGWIVMVMLLLDLLRKRMGWDNIPHQTWFTAATGVTGGATTYLANAAGPIMNLYFLSFGLPKQQFIGTAAWYFMIVNASKIPFYLYLGIVNRDSIGVNLAMAPLIAVGAVVGIVVFHHIPQKLFNSLVLVLAGVAALKLIFS